VRATGQTPPSYHTVYNVIRAIPDALKTLALDGDKAYRAKPTIDTLHRHEAEHPNQIWQADHTQLDLGRPHHRGQLSAPASTAAGG
jgi:putative transposase